MSSPYASSSLSTRNIQIYNGDILCNEFVDPVKFREAAEKKGFTMGRKVVVDAMYGYASYNHIGKIIGYSELNYPLIHVQFTAGDGSTLARMINIQHLKLIAE